MPDHPPASSLTNDTVRPLALRVLAIVSLITGGVLLVAWIAGRVLSDRWIWSQWLLWLPPLTVVPGFLLLAVGARLLHRRKRVVLILCGAAILGPIGEFVHLWRPGVLPEMTPSHLRLLHWTAGPQMRSTVVLAKAIDHAKPDVVVVLGARRAAAGEALANWGIVPGPLARGEFMIFSRIPVRSCRSLARSEDIQLVLLRLAPEGRSPITLLLLDLPSDPWRSRWAVAAVTRHLTSLTLDVAPDLVLGDFNMTQESRAMRSILPGWRTAWPTGGRGWGGTWPRRLPLWRIDHVLVHPGGEMPIVATFDPGEGRHRAQIIDMPLQPASPQN